MEQINLQDPLSRFAKGTFLHVFSFLSTDETDAGAKVCRRWRECLRSDFSLFTEVDVNVYGGFREEDGSGDYGNENEEGMNEVIGKLKRFASLSNNRLKDSYIAISPFVDDMPSRDGSWANSKLRHVFEILELSNRTLKKLYLDGPMLVLTKVSARSISAKTCTIISKLSSFPNLKEVHICITTLLKLVCKSPGPDGKILTIHSTSLPDYNDDFDEPRRRGESASAPFVNLIKSMKSFTGGKLVYLGGPSTLNLGDDEVVFSPGILEELEESKAVLETLDLCQVQVDPSEQGELAQLVRKFPNLICLKLEAYCHADEDWEFSFPAGTKPSSKLKVLKLHLERGKIRWNDQMLGWIGNGIETLSLEQSGSMTDLGGNPFKSLFAASDSTLKVLNISGIFSSSSSNMASKEPMQSLARLEQISVSGNATIINFFTSSFKYPSLKSLSIRIDHGAGIGNDVSYKKLFDLITDHQDSIESISLSEEKGDERKKLGIEGLEFTNFNKLKELSFRTQCKDYVTPFLKANYPKLKKLEFSSSFEEYHSLFLQQAPQLKPKYLSARYSVFQALEGQ